MEETIKENKKLKERVKKLEERNAFLENLLNRGSSGNTSAYNSIRLMIIEKVQKEVEQSEKLKEWQNKDTRQRAERQIMRDLKWDLRVRNIADFRLEHIKLAKEYIDKYVIPENLRKSRWIE